MKKLPPKEGGCIIFASQDFRNDYSQKELFALACWCQITTEGDRHLLFSYGPLEELVEAVEVYKIAKEVVEIASFSVLGEYHI